MAIERIIRCTVVYDSDENAPAGARPSDLLPWADPYIASLVKKLQREVRQDAVTKRRPELDNRDLSPWDIWDMCYDETAEADVRWDNKTSDERACAGV